MRKIKLLCVLLLSGVWLQAQSIAEKEQAILNKIKTANANYQTISSEFKQSKHLPLLSEEVYSNGSFYYEKPDKMVMEFAQPKGDLMLINQEVFVMLIAGKRRETTAKANAKMRGLKDVLLSAFNGDLLPMGVEKLYCEESAAAYRISLDLDINLNKSNITKVIIHYDKKDYSLTALQLIEADESYTTYEFHHKKFNQEIDQKHFDVSKKRK